MPPKIIKNRLNFAHKDFSLKSSKIDFYLLSLKVLLGARRICGYLEERAVAGYRFSGSHPAFIQTDKESGVVDIHDHIDRIYQLNFHYLFTYKTLVPNCTRSSSYESLKILPPRRYRYRRSKDLLYRICDTHPPKIIKNRWNFALSEKFKFRPKNHDFCPKTGFFTKFPVYTGQKLTKKIVKNPDTSSAFFALFRSKSTVFPVYRDLQTPKNRVFRSNWPPPKIIKNRLNFACSKIFLKTRFLPKISRFYLIPPSPKS